MKHSIRRLKYGIRRELAARLLLSIAALWPALSPAQPGAQPGINTPYLVHPDVARWNRAFTREDREVYAKRDEILAAAAVQPGMSVADIGAGTGLFTMMFAEAVKPGGRVYAIDISQAFIDYIRQTAQARKRTNITAIVGDGIEVPLPEASVDLIFMSDVYHHFEHPGQTLASIRKALRPGGRMVVVDYERIPGVTPPQRIEHVRLDKQTTIKEIGSAGFRFVGEKKLMRQNYFLVFQRPQDIAAPPAQEIAAPPTRE
ncbi:MAG TPA: class I SAM-dependent methyltransferase [Burkholderiales bacterium]|nr:class I SAM-dependent methyltransferase [Burkholderiales bacterium]